MNENSYRRSAGVKTTDFFRAFQICKQKCVENYLFWLQWKALFQNLIYLHERALLSPPTPNQQSSTEKRNPQKYINTQIRTYPLNFHFHPTPGKSCVLILIKYESYTKMKARKKSRSRLENWDEMTEFLALVSKPEIRWKNSRARLQAREWKKKILVLVSKHEIERKIFSILSRKLK